MEDSSLTKKLNMPSLCSPCRCRANANGWSSLTHTGERASLACYECVPQHFVDASCSFLLVPQASSGLRKSHNMLQISRWLNMTGDDKKTAVDCITLLFVLNERKCHGETDEIRTRCSNDRGL